MGQLSNWPMGDLSRIGRCVSDAQNERSNPEIHHHPHRIGN